MNSLEQINRIKNFDNDKLMDVVKNYRQYGYDDSLRNEAILILEERGLSKEELKLTGNFENRSYDYAQEIFNSFKRNSNVAFVFYGLFIVCLVFVQLFANILHFSGVFIIPIVLFWLMIFLYVFFLVKSFFNQIQFYKIIGKEYGSEGMLVYLFLGMPFYFLAYFYFRNQMNEQMRFIK